jgi:hypothetical protein
VLGLAGALVLGAPSVASSAPARGYVLKHPNRERCKKHYVRKVKHAKVHSKTVRQVWCVHAGATSKPTPGSTTPAPAPAPAPTPAPAPAPTPALPPTFTIVTTAEGGGVLVEQPAYKTVSVSVEAFGSGPGTGVAGVPVTVTFADHVTGAVLGSFTASSYGGSCDIVKEITGGNWVLKGESVPPYSGCPVGTITAPENHYIEVMGSFAGNAQYAASVSKWELFV